MLRIFVDFKNAITLPEKIFTIEDICVWICRGNFCQLWQEYMWSAVNVLKDDPNISDLTKRHDTQLNLFDVNGKLV